MPTRVCSRVGVITRFRVMADMDITAAQYEDLLFWYVQVKNQVDYGLPKNVRWSVSYIYPFAALTVVIRSGFA